MAKLFIVILFACSLVFDVESQRTIDDKYDLQRLPWDLRPAWYMIGVWEAYEPQSGRIQSLIPYPDRIDFGIGYLPMFGARNLNYTGHIFGDQPNSILFHEYGFLLVKNISRNDPTVKAAFMTVTDVGYTTLEEGSVNNNVITLQLNNFLQRSFNMARAIQLTRLTREFSVTRDILTLALNYEANNQQSNYRIFYRKILGPSCTEGCRFMEQRLNFVNACAMCR